MPEEDKGLVDDVGVGDAEDVKVEVTDVAVVAVVAVDVAEDEVEKEEEVAEENVEEEEVEVEEMEEDEDVVPSTEAPFSTVKVLLTASWPAESIIWIS